MAFLIARSMTSLDIDSALALAIARRSLGFIAGSGMPDFAATVISRDRLENIFERTASWRPFRCMMFLNFECPAMSVRQVRKGCRPLLPSARRVRNPCRGRGLGSRRERRRLDHERAQLCRLRRGPARGAERRAGPLDGAAPPDLR